MKHSETNIPRRAEVKHFERSFRERKKTAQTHEKAAFTPICHKPSTLTGKPIHITLNPHMNTVRQMTLLLFFKPKDKLELRELK